jgi:beta-lactamase superfamily II metal-dependent hydrolase
MVLVNGYEPNRIQNNTIYAIKKETLRSLRTRGVALDPIEDSYVFGFQMRMPKNAGRLFDRSVRLSVRERIARGIQLESQHDNAKIPDKYEEELKAIVRNVGQGNWNELLCGGKVKLVYDIGTDMHAKKKDVNAVVDNKDMEYQQSSPGVIISHWDVDHYNCLLGLHDDTINKLSYFVARNDFPTETSKRVRDRVRQHLDKSTIFFVPYERRIKKRGSVEMVLLSSETNQLKIFNAARHKDRNRSGIIVSIETSKSNIIFSGDAHYDQISDYVLPNIGDVNTKNNLVVPHHGGYAGNYQYQLRAGIKPEIAAVSVKHSKQYRHPKKKNIVELIKTGFKAKRTDFEGHDIEIPL